MNREVMQLALDALKLTVGASADVRAFDLRIDAIEALKAELAKPEPGHAIQWDEDRIDIIGPNGNDGLHYDVPA